MTVNKGDVVTVEYEGKLDNGEVFDATSKTGKPIQFEVGSGQVIKGFDVAVTGMEKGEEKDFKIESKDAYGDRNPELKKEIPKNMINIKQELQPGMTIALQTPQGQQIPLKIEEVKQESIIVDMNHPLAGQNLNFKIKVVDIQTKK